MWHPRKPEENLAGAEDRAAPTFLSAVATFKLAADDRRSRVVAVAVPTGCSQPVGLAQDPVALGPACSSAVSKKRTFKNRQNRTFKTCANNLRATRIPAALRSAGQSARARARPHPAKESPRCRRRMGWKLWCGTSRRCMNSLARLWLAHGSPFGGVPQPPRPGLRIA